MRELLRTKQTVVTVDDETRVLRRARTEEHFESAAQMEAAYGELVRVMDRVDRPRYAQLVDVRDAPPRNDPEFEGIVARHHAGLYRGFLANVVLVQSVVGKLHVKRLLDGSGVKARVFDNETEALEYLAEAVRESRKP
jgi:hypothetical protein